MTQEAMIALIRARGIRDPLVLGAMGRVPRAAFVPEGQKRQAHGDHPLPIGHRQTISQPYIVAMMTEALALTPSQRVLEIGTGSGYQAAILAEMGMEVYSVERIPALHQAAQHALEAAGYAQVRCKLGDGYHGWPDHAPYAGIIVTAASPEAPPPLLAQLADGGCMVIPLGRPGRMQELWQLTRHGEEFRRESMGGVAFVPFVHDAA